MIPSILKNINPDDIDFLVRNFQYQEDQNYSFNRLFPYMERATLDWHVAESGSNRVIAADVVARGASIDIKGRGGFGRISGDIPKIAIAQFMDENEYYDLRALLNQYQGNEKAVNLIKKWADDYTACYNGVMSRLEWMAMRTISTGKLSLTNLNNVGIVSENDADYQLDTNQKLGVDTVYTGSSTSGKPFTVDIPAVIEKAHSIGVRLTKARMNQVTWSRFIAQTEVKNFCATFLQNQTSTQGTPTLEAVNSYLSAHSELYGDLQFEVIKTSVNFYINGAYTEERTFADNVIGFYSEDEQGETYWVRPIDMDIEDCSIKSMKELMMFKRYAEADPVIEKTMAIANAFPVWKQAPNCVLLDVSATSWSIN